MRRDKKAAQKKKSRELARKDERKAAATTKLGPTFITGEWRSDALPPQLVNVVATRVFPNGQLLAHSMLIDRTCLGVKNAFTFGPLGRDELDDILERIETVHTDGVEEIDFATAQSVVLHALAYARSLGFDPNEDFESKFLAPLPKGLVNTPLAKRARPFYVAGPHDDVEDILATLAEAVGPDGFDFGEALDGDDDEPLARAPDEEALNDAISTWNKHIGNDPRLDIIHAFGSYFHAMTGKPMGDRESVDRELMTSLPLYWTMLFRPLAGGGTGLELARATKEMAPVAGVLDQLARTRAALFDVLWIGDEMIADCRDVFDGSRFDVRFAPSLADTTTRWMRFFGYITPMADGTWYPPSVLFGHPWLRNTDPEAAIATLNGLLATLGIDERVDPAKPQLGLTRFAALMHGVLTRSVKPTEAQADEDEAPLYFVNSANDRFELHEAVVKPGKKLAGALAKADDFVADGEGFAWRVNSDEILGSAHPNDEGGFDVIANSTPRFERLLTRLSELAGTRLEAEDVRVLRPWETQARAVAEPVPGSRTVVFGLEGATPEMTEAGSDELVVAHMLRTLDEEVPAVGGRPRDVVGTKDGRARVEAWLQDLELQGAPGDGHTFLDLDELRAELGLPPVLEE